MREITLEERKEKLNTIGTYYDCLLEIYEWVALRVISYTQYVDLIEYIYSNSEFKWVD